MNLHIGRSWTGHPLEDACPCPKAPCGLVVLEQASPECDQHSSNPLQARTMRQIHDSEHCPGIEAELSEQDAADLAAMAEPEDWPAELSLACQLNVHQECLGRVSRALWPVSPPCGCSCHARAAAA